MAIRGTTKYYSNKQEKRVAQEIEGNTVIGSGSLWGAKGDVRTDKYLIECKTTEKTFYSLSASTWLKIEKEAIKDGLRIPAMCIDLKNGGNRLAVLKYHPLLFKKGEYFRTVGTPYKSIKISEGLSKSIIIFENLKETGNLIVLPWDYFIENLVEV